MSTNCKTTHSPSNVSDNADDAPSVPTSSVGAKARKRACSLRPPETLHTTKVTLPYGRRSFTASSEVHGRSSLCGYRLLGPRRLAGRYSIPNNGYLEPFLIPYYPGLYATVPLMVAATGVPLISCAATSFRSASRTTTSPSLPYISVPFSSSSKAR